MIEHESDLWPVRRWGAQRAVNSSRVFVRPFKSEQERDAWIKENPARRSAVGKRHPAVKRLRQAWRAAVSGAPMTLDQAAKFYRWSPVHGYQSATEIDGQITEIYGLGIWGKDLQKLREQVPGLLVFVKSDYPATRLSTPDDSDNWLRVDLKMAR